MDDKSLRFQLINTAIGASSRGLVSLPRGFHTETGQRRAEIAAWIVQQLLFRTEQGDRQVLEFWRHWDRPKSTPRPSRDGSKPRVAFLTPGLNLGGAERVTVDLARHLNHQQFDVLGIGVRNPAPHYAPLLMKACQTVPVVIGRYAFETLAQRADLVVYWGTAELPTTAPVSSVYVSHGAGACARHWGPLLSAKRISLVAVSHWAAQVFSGRADVTIIHNGVDEQRCKSRLARDMVRRRWGLKPSDIAVGYVGRFCHEKNVTAAVMATSELGLPYRAVYVGAGRPQAIAFLKRFRPQPVIVPQTEQIGDVYNALDCFVLASHSEGFSLSLAEAWLCGCPAIVTPVGAVPELEKEFGQLTVRVPIGASTTELAEAVQEVFSPENRVVVERAQTVAKKHFTAGAMASRWANYLLKLHRSTKR